MIVLGIETSCDETAAAVLAFHKKGLEILSSVVSSQVKLHAKWGGVVPSLAAREHLKNISPVVQMALQKSSLSMKDIDLISVTRGPGLIPALLIGSSFARSLSLANKKPLIGVHHIEGHIYANFIGLKQNERINFPVLCLVVSGGHTQLILMKKHLQYEIIGETLDDAAGEAFDKVARMLNLGYPGGPAIAAQAAKHESPTEKKPSDKKKSFGIQLPRPMLKSKNLDFSFSGLKTAVLYEIKRNGKLMKNNRYVSALAWEFQQAVIDVLTEKTISAAKMHRPRTILLAGGVAANQELRRQLGKSIAANLPKNTAYQIPVMEYCIDNAAMIATAGYFCFEKMTAKQKKGLLFKWKDLSSEANLNIYNS